MPTRRNDRQYLIRAAALKRQARKANSPCWLCHYPIDYALDYTHPMSFTADHVDPVGTGGHMLGPLMPAHRSCNSRRQTQAITDMRVIEPPATRTQW